jgi:cell division protein FtsL
MLRTVQKMEAWLVKFQRGEKILFFIRAVAILIVKILWFWLAGAEESAVINNIPELLKQNLCITGTIDAG